MYLKVVVDNTLETKVKHEKMKEMKTCFNNVKVDESKTVYNRQKFSDWTIEEEQEEIFELIEDDFIVEFEDEQFLFELMRDKFSLEKSQYPLEPDFDSNRDDAIWYVSPDQAFGCWIINKFKKRFVTINVGEAPKQDWLTKIYKSPYPLHDHESSAPLKSRMAWYVDEQGWGQYVLLANGKIEMLSTSKPSNWEK